MGNELAKKYDVEPDALASGGHDYLWQVYPAVRKKDKMKVSVFVLDKAELDKRLKGSRRAKELRDRVLEIYRRDHAAMKEFLNLKEGPPPGVLRPVEILEESKRSSSSPIVMVTERVSCSLGNALHKHWQGVEATKVPIELLALELCEAEQARGAYHLLEALNSLRNTATRRVHMGICPEVRGHSTKRRGLFVLLPFRVLF